VRRGLLLLTLLLSVSCAAATKKHGLGTVVLNQETACDFYIEHVGGPGNGIVVRSTSSEGWDITCNLLVYDRIKNEYGCYEITGLVPFYDNGRIPWMAVQFKRPIPLQELEH
jgi:hypothetical protein